MVVRQTPASGLSRRATPDGWSIGTNQLKRYPHFDRVVSVDEAFDIATNPDAVARHPFYPFLVYTKHFTRFAEDGKKGKAKDRRIRFAARLDAHIMARYRVLLSERYEKAVTSAGLTKAVLAYRRLRDPATGKGMSNIDHARAAFEHVRRLGTCCAVALDIKSFFESLDHGRLKQAWAGLLQCTKLPDDHYAVFSAVTAYREVELDEALRALGYVIIQKDRWGNDRRVRACDAKGKPRSVPTQICTPIQFRNLIVGGRSGRGLIKPNAKRYGIPQGSPISDLLANLYLLEFDIRMHSALSAIGGVYMRYSDDILLIVPGGEAEARHWHDYAASELPQHGGAMAIATDKSQIIAFAPAINGQSSRQVHGPRTLHGLEYLGFRYDGRGVYIRNSTLSSLRRKVAAKAKAAAWRCATRYPNKSVTELTHLLDVNALVNRFGRVADFETVSHIPSRWTFWTYAVKAAQTFGKDGRFIRKQMRNHVDHIRRRAAKELDVAVRKRDIGQATP